MSCIYVSEGINTDEGWQRARACAYCSSIRRDLSSSSRLLPPLYPNLALLQFFLGLVSVTPQILLPLAGDLAPPNRRASAISIVLAGLLLGILFARVLAGLIADKGNVSDIYWMSFGLQVRSKLASLGF